MTKPESNEVADLLLDVRRTSRHVDSMRARLESFGAGHVRLELLESLATASSVLATLAGELGSRARADAEHMTCGGGR